MVEPPHLNRNQIWVFIIFPKFVGNEIEAATFKTTNIRTVLLMVQKSGEKTHLGCSAFYPVNHGRKNCEPQLVIAGFLHHPQLVSHGEVSVSASAWKGMAVIRPRKRPPRLRGRWACCLPGKSMAFQLTFLYKLIKSVSCPRKSMVGKSMHFRFKQSFFRGHVVSFQGCTWKKHRCFIYVDPFSNKIMCSFLPFERVFY